MAKFSDPAIEALYNAVVAAQMQSIPAVHILQQLIIDVARLHPDPEKYVAGLYERVSPQLDPALDRPDKEAIAQSRFVLDALFRHAVTEVRKAPKGPPSK